MFFSITKIKAIRHYNRMINWARTQPENDEPDPDFMFDVIGENWYSCSCSYCKKHSGKCSECKLSLPGALVAFSCCSFLWSKMSSSKTWGEWIKNAELVREYIRENG